MKGITMCADCAYYNIKTHKCTLGCTGEPCIENGDDVRFFTDCPLPNVVEVRHGEWHECWHTDTVCASICTNCEKAATQARMIVGQELMTNVRYPLCPNCGAKMDGGE